MELYTGLLRNKPQTLAVNIFEVTTFSTKHIFDEMSCIGLCQTCSETTLSVFPRDGSNVSELDASQFQGSSY